MISLPLLVLSALAMFASATVQGATGFGFVIVAAPVLTIIGAVCVRYAGEVYDRTGGYDLMFITFVAAQVAAAMLMIWVRLRAKAAVKPQGRAAI